MGEVVSNEPIANMLKDWLKGADKIVVAGIGNSIRRDDYVGIIIVKELRGRIPDSIHLIECETVPESFVDEIVKIRPTHVLLIDAALMGKEPGTSELINSHLVASLPSISTHTLPIKVFCEYVKFMTGAEVYLLLIEPKDYGFGEGLTIELENTASEMIKVLTNVFCYVAN